LRKQFGQRLCAGHQQNQLCRQHSCCAGNLVEQQTPCQQRHHCDDYGFVPCYGDFTRRGTGRWCSRSSTAAALLPLQQIPSPAA
jgi:hypothetical protein